MEYSETRVEGPVQCVCVGGDSCFFSDVVVQINVALICTSNDFDCKKDSVYSSAGLAKESGLMRSTSFAFSREDFRHSWNQ